MNIDTESTHTGARLVPSADPEVANAQPVSFL